MKTPLLLILCLLPTFFMGQTPEKHAKVVLQMDRSDMVAYLNDNGFEIDHAHKHGKDQLEVTITHTELNWLADLNIRYEVLIEDVAANFREMAAQSANSRDAACGLANFDSGEMGSYHSYADMQTHINSMQAQFPELVQISEIGTSIEGRTIFAVKISDNVATDESAVEGVAYYDAITHAREPMGLESVLYYMWSLLENYNTDPEMTYLVNHREMYFVPVVNPDGYVFNQTTDPQGGGLWRKNRRESDGGCIGIDLNRNFSFGWGDDAGSSGAPCANTYRGTEPFSEPEAQAVRDFTNMIQPAAAFSCHTYSDVFLCPNGFNSDLLQYETYAEFASEFTPKTYNGYGNWIQTIGYFGAGTTHDYLNSTGAIAYTPEIGHAFWENPAVICDRIQEMLPAMKYMTWVAGAYPCFHDFEMMNDEPIWNGWQNIFKIRVKNRGLSKTAENVMVEVNTAHTAINFVNSTAMLGNIPPRQFAENDSAPFTFTINEPLDIGEQIAINVTVSQDGNITYEDIIYLYAGDTEVLFEEDGENGIDQWSTTLGVEWDTTFMDSFRGDHCVTDTRYGNFDGNSNNNITMINTFDLSNADHPWLEFNAKWSFEPEEDYAKILISIDEGLSWIELSGLYTSDVSGGIGYTNNQHWVQERIDLSIYQGQPNLKIGFFISTDIGIESDGFYFDDLRIVNYIDPDFVSVKENGTQNLVFDAFPNPTADALTVHVSQSQPTYDMTLFDLQGRVLLAERSEQATTSLSLAQLPNGIYWLKVSSNGYAGMKKIVVLK